MPARWIRLDPVATNEAKVSAEPNSNRLIALVRPDRFELPTFWFVARRSIQLSYGRSRYEYTNVSATDPAVSAD